jgi:hypothetical protein
LKVLCEGQRYAVILNGCQSLRLELCRRGDAVAEQDSPNDVRLQSLSDRDIAILEFERQTWSHHGAKEQAIRNSFDLGPARYYQLLNGVIDLPAAAQFDPILVRRLRRTRDARAEARASRGFTSTD